MIGKPLVSVVTVCYNEEKSIKRVLESVLCQRYDKGCNLCIAKNLKKGEFPSNMCQKRMGAFMMQ